MKPQEQEAQALPAGDRPFNVHAEYQRNLECGYIHAMNLKAVEVQSMAQHLRGIRAISAVLMVEDPDALTLGDWIRGGLLEALHVLAEDAYDVLEQSREALC